jgi:hypothetical protein
MRGTDRFGIPKEQAKPRKDVGLKESATGRSEILSVPAFAELHEPEYTRNLLAGSGVSRRAMACFVKLAFVASAHVCEMQKPHLTRREAHLLTVAAPQTPLWRHSID